MRPKIIDKFTDLLVSRQRKWQLRHPEKDNEIKQRYVNSGKRKTSNHEWYLKKRQKDNLTSEIKNEI